ncbi:MAG: hypothetical protein P4L53_19820 [Candidatus Obscuribacterales bacterium]|nr:hypothetical protein [Candidatus Obscuribacterales bacterium]
MSKSDTTPAVSFKSNAPEHHRVKPEQHHRAFQVQPGHSYCRVCGAVNFHKHWYIAPAQEHALKLDKSASQTLCPGCSRVEQELFEGELILANSRFAELCGEIVALIKHTEGRCWYKNPTAKIAGATEEDGIIHVMTTTKFLAERIGKELKQAFKGNLEIKRTDTNVKVYWTD